MLGHVAYVGTQGDSRRSLPCHFTCLQASKRFTLVKVPCLPEWDKVHRAGAYCDSMHFQVKCCVYYEYFICMHRHLYAFKVQRSFQITTRSHDVFHIVIASTLNQP